MDTASPAVGLWPGARWDPAGVFQCGGQFPRLAALAAVCVVVLLPPPVRPLDPVGGRAGDSSGGSGFCGCVAACRVFLTACVCRCRRAVYRNNCRPALCCARVVGVSFRAGRLSCVLGLRVRFGDCGVFGQARRVAFEKRSLDLAHQVKVRAGERDADRKAARVRRDALCERFGVRTSFVQVCV